MQILPIKNQNFEKPSRNPSNRTKVKILERKKFWISLKKNLVPRMLSSGGQISTKHLKTSIRPFFATCRLPQYPEFWRCVETGTLFLGPHWKRSLKSLDNLLKVPMRNIKLLPRPRKMVAVVLNIFFLGVDMFFIFWCALSPPLPLDRGK